MAVLPEVEEVEVALNPGDLHIEVCRAGGPGGQHVNTTDSAVRIVARADRSRGALSGRAVAAQEQGKGAQGPALAPATRSSASEQDAKRAEERRSQIGSAERSDKIRTYNFPQSRLTDHRIGLTVHNLAGILEGDLDEVIQALSSEHQRAQLAAQ